MLLVKLEHKVPPALRPSPLVFLKPLWQQRQGSLRPSLRLWPITYYLSRIRKMAFRVEAFTIEFLNTLEESEKALEVEEVVQ